MNIIDNDLLSMQEARILVENAREAQKKLATFSQEYVNELARLSFEETDLGKVEDKLVKDKFVITYLRNRLKGMKCVGVIGTDEKNKTMDIGVPIGVIAAFCPETSPVSTIIYKATIAI